MAGGMHGTARGRRSGRARRAPMSEINVTPMVDVMLVLLVIFMVTAPLLSAGVPINLPDSRAHPLDQQPRQVTITLTRDGGAYLDQARLAPGELAERISALPPGPDGKPPLILLRADKGLDYGSVVAVMGELTRAGVTAISLVTGTGVAPPAGAGAAQAAVTPGSAARQ